MALHLQRTTSTVMNLPLPRRSLGLSTQERPGRPPPPPGRRLYRAKRTRKLNPFCLQKQSAQKPAAPGYEEGNNYPVLCFHLRRASTLHHEWESFCFDDCRFASYASVNSSCAHAPPRELAFFFSRMANSRGWGHFSCQMPRDVDEGRGQMPRPPGSYVPNQHCSSFHSLHNNTTFSIFMCDFSFL